jgi:hypothetical protein
MRHKSIDTTMAYYVELDTDDIGEELWNSHTLANSDVFRGPKLPR